VLCSTNASLFDEIGSDSGYPPFRQAALQGLTGITTLTQLHISGPLIHSPPLALAVSSWGEHFPSLRDLALELDEARQSSLELLNYGSLMYANP
jgi:hypothetical protein